MRVPGTNVQRCYRGRDFGEWFKSINVGHQLVVVVDQSPTGNSPTVKSSNSQIANANLGRLRKICTLGQAGLRKISPRWRKISANLRKILRSLRKICAGLRKIFPHLRKICAGLRKISPHLRKICAGLREILAGARLNLVWLRGIQPHLHEILLAIA